MNIIDENKGLLSGLEQLRSLIADGRKPPIAITMDIDLVEVEHGKAIWVGRPDERTYNPIGTVHGGYAATVLDSACGCAVHTMLSSTQGYTTLELKVAYHRALTRNSGEIRAEASVLSIGRRAAFAEGRLLDGSGRLCASATSTLLVFDLPT